MMHLLEYDFLAILDIDTPCGMRYGAALEVVVGSVGIVCLCLQLLKLAHAESATATYEEAVS